MRNGDFDEAELERQLRTAGFLARLFTRVMRRVSKPWHLYPVGLLMGLGFDTATQVALLVLAGRGQRRSRCRGTPSWCCRCCSRPA